MKDRELTEEEKAFIKSRLKKKNISYDAEEEVFIKEKLPAEPGRLRSTAWTLLRPRNWSVLILLIAGGLTALLLSMTRQVNSLLGSGVMEAVDAEGISMAEISSIIGIKEDDLDLLVKVYSQTPVYISIILIVGIILIALLWMLDIYLSNRRNQRYEVRKR